MTWPELSYVAVNPKEEIVGYILAKMYVPAPCALDILYRTVLTFVPSFCLALQLEYNRDEENTEVPSGHVTSISVLRSYRRLGLAAKLMRQSRQFPSYDPTRCLILILFIPLDLL